MPPRAMPSLRFDNTFLFDVLIIGGGPAGLSAALTLSRVKRTAAVFSDNRFCNDSVSLIHNTLTRDHVSPADIRAFGKADVDRYGTTHFVDRSIVHARKDNSDSVFVIEDSEGIFWQGRKLILAAGSTDVFPPGIKGYAENWGTHIHQCIIYSGLEKSDRAAGVLTFPNAASLYGVSTLFQLECPSVTIFTNGPLNTADAETREALRVAQHKGAIVDDRHVQRFVDVGSQGINVVFLDGRSVQVGFLVHKPATVPNASIIALNLAVQVIPDGLGGTMIKRNEPFGETNVTGVFSAGDVNTTIKQVTTAMHHGMCAGLGAHQQITKESNEALAVSLRSANS